MNFDWNPEQIDLRRKVGALFDAEALAEIEKMEQADTADLKSLTYSHLRRLSGTDYLTVGSGPAGRGQTMSLLAAQEIVAGLSGSLFLSVETTARLFGGLLAGFGDPNAFEDILDPLSSGELIGAVAVSEPEPEAHGIGTICEPDGDDYVVTGRKDYVTNAPIADRIAVTGELDGKPVIFLVEPGMPNLSIGPRMRTLGHAGLAVSSLVLDRVRIPRRSVIGPFADRAFLDYLSLMQDLVLTMSAVGLVGRTAAAAKEYARSHKRGGRNIFRFQEVRFKLAEMLTWSHSASLLAFRAGWLYCSADPEARTVLNCAKVFSAEAAEQVSAMAMQIMAGQGYLCGNPAERAYREARLAGIAGTTSEKARMAIADDLLKPYQV